MKTTQAHQSPPSALGVHDDQPSHGFASPSIRPNTRRADSDPVEISVAVVLVGCIVAELTIFAAVVSTII
jgi:hypothetical protein